MCIKKRARRRKKSFKKRFDEAIERDKKSMYTESDKEFLKELQKLVKKD